jgi:signal transduction histidine kinase
LAIHDQAFRAYEMIADLMLFAKPPQMELSEVELDSLLREIRLELEPLARNRELQIQLHVDTSPLVVRGDAAQLGVAITAICKNGLESMDVGGVLSIQGGCSTDREHVIVSIEDQGDGISDIVKRHLFDPFFSGREAGRGLGFGLSKAWRIVEQHAGTIEVSSRPSLGSCFVVTLPVMGPLQGTSPRNFAITHE